ncbi:hypothetical protein BS78_03G157000 [Paspalum vaginatum]|nr:hypothetical protein BS78_03G157000 [Paspalum vaginatum]
MTSFIRVLERVLVLAMASTASLCSGRMAASWRPSAASWRSGRGRMHRPLHGSVHRDGLHNLQVLVARACWWWPVVNW